MKLPYTESDWWLVYLSSEYLDRQWKSFQMEVSSGALTKGCQLVTWHPFNNKALGIDLHSCTACALPLGYERVGLGNCAVRHTCAHTWRNPWPYEELHSFRPGVSKLFNTGVTLIFYRFSQAPQKRTFIYEWMEFKERAGQSKLHPLANASPLRQLSTVAHMP